MLSMLLFLQLYLSPHAWAGPVSVNLHSEDVTTFEGWYIKLDTGLVLDFSQVGAVQLTVPADSRTFEIVNAQGSTLLVGAWTNYHGQNPVTLAVSDSEVILHEVVTASRMRQSTWDVPGEISVIRPDSQKERAVTQTSDWLKEEAEVLLQKTNLGGGSPIIRGMSGNRVLLMVDGFRLNNATYRLGLNQYLNTVPAASVAQFEVLSGPSGVQYGSDGLGGTVHLRSVDPANVEDDELRYSGFYSSADSTNTHLLSGNWKRGDLSIQGHFKYSRFQDLEAADPVGEQIPTGYDGWDGSLNATWTIDEDQRLRVINGLSRAAHVPRTDRILSGRDLLWEYHPQQFSMHALRYENSRHRTWADHFDIGLGYMNQDEGNRRISTGSPDSLRETRDLVDTLQFNGTFTKIGRGVQWVYGFDVAHDTIDSSAERIDLVTGEITPDDAKFPDDAAYRAIGIFTTADISLGEGHTLRAGLRHSWVDLEGTLAEPLGLVKQDNSELTPSLSWRVKRERFVLSLGASQGFRAPSLEDSLALGPSNQGFDAPNPDLEPERLWNYEANLRFRLPGVLVQTAVYHSRYEDLMEKIPGTYLGQDTFQGEPVFILDNVGEAEIDGVSIQLSGHWHKRHDWQVDAAWTEGTATDRDEPMRRIPPLRGNLMWRYRADVWGLTGTFSWADPQDRLSSGDISDSRIPEGGTPGYGVIHLRGHYRFSETLSLKLGLENLTDKLYQQHGSGVFEPGRRAVLELQAMWR